MSTTDRPNDVPSGVEPERPIRTVSEWKKGHLMGRAQMAAEIYTFSRNLGMSGVATVGGLAPSGYVIGGWTLAVAVVCFGLILMQISGSLEKCVRRAEGGAAEACEGLGLLGWRDAR